MTRKNNKKDDGAAVNNHDMGQGTPSPYISSMETIECNSPEDLIRAVGSMQKDTLAMVRDITTKTVEVTKQYVDDNVACLLKHVEDMQNVVSDLYEIMRQIAEIAKDAPGAESLPNA